MRMRTISGVVALFLALSSYAQVPVVGVQGATLSQIAGTSTLVTVVMKGTGAEDPNLRVIGVTDKYFTVETDNGEHNAYLYANVSEVRVQGGKVEAKTHEVDIQRALTDDEKKIIDRAAQRAGEIFAAANDDQSLKMRAAVLLILSGNEDGRAYLNLLVASNDLRTRLSATATLYSAGDTNAAKPVLEAGLASGEAPIKTYAARLAGQLKYEPAVPILLDMVQRRTSAYFSAAAIALGRLGNRDSIPLLLSALESPDEQKSAAAAHALSMLGGTDVIEAVKLKLANAKGTSRYDMLTVLYALGDPIGRQTLVDETLQNPVEALHAAILLAGKGDSAGVRWIRENYLPRAVSTNPQDQIQRVEAIGALYLAGYASAMTDFQDILRVGNAQVQMAVCAEIAVVGKRNLLSILQASIESSDPKVAWAAARAVYAIVNPEFRARTIGETQ